MNDDDNGDYKENWLESSQLDELNQLVVSSDQGGGARRALTAGAGRAAPEGPCPNLVGHPASFKSGVVLMPY